MELGGDLREHLPTLRRLACQCAHVTEFGTRWGDAATAFLLGRPKKLVSYDTARNWQVGLLESLALDAEFEFRLVETTEIWAFYMGAPLELEIVADQGLRPLVLSSDCSQAAAPQGAWRRLRSLGDWTLVSCSTAPGLAADAVETPNA